VGRPLSPCHRSPADAAAGFFSIHALKDADLPAKLAAFIAAGKPTLLTDALAEALKGKLDLQAANVRVLGVKGDPKGLLTLPQSELDAIRAMMLKPLNASLTAPNKVAFYLFRDGSWVVENFNDEPVKAEVNGAAHTIPARGWVLHFQGPAPFPAAGGR
jgi:hypothetical protein